MQPQSRRGSAACTGATEVSKVRSAGHTATILQTHHRGNRQDTQWADRQGILRQRLVQQCEKVDWDIWQGPAPRRPYKDNIHPYNWHWFRHWGTGEALNNGTHSIDLCRWALGVDYPNRIISQGGRYQLKDDWQFYDTLITSFDYG